MIVVAAAVLVHGGRVLLCQRKPGGAQGLKWEFPGGKLESNESPEAALERELEEELGIRTRTGRILYTAFQTCEQGGLLVLFYASALLAGEPQTLDCRAFRWVQPSQLETYDLAPLDAEAVSNRKDDWFIES